MPGAALAPSGLFQGCNVREHITPWLSCGKVTALGNRRAPGSGVWLHSGGSGFHSGSGQQSLFSVYFHSVALFAS